MAKVKLAQGHQTSREIPDQKLHALRRNCIMVEVEVLDEDLVALEAGTNSAEILVCDWPNFVACIGKTNQEESWRTFD